AACLRDARAPWDTAVGCQAPGQLRQLGVAQHGLADLAARQERGAEDDTLLPVEEDLEHAREPACAALLAFAPVLVDEAVEVDLAPQRELGLACVPEIGEQTLRLARRLLHAVEERREPRLPLVEPRAAEDRDRNHEGR